MEQIVLKEPEYSSNGEAALPSTGTITYEDENGNVETISFPNEGAGVATF